jgi:SpoVK/Ycf46/Vps4 family AAA+-type ATPase
LDELAAATEGFSPADLKSLAQEAALAAMARTPETDGTPSVTHEDFVEAVGRLQAGRQRERVLTG